MPLNTEWAMLPAKKEMRLMTTYEPITPEVIEANSPPSKAICKKGLSNRAEKNVKLIDCLPFLKVYDKAQK